MPEISNLLPHAVEPVDITRKPERSGRIFGNFIHRIFRQAAWRVGIHRVWEASALISIEKAKTAVGPDPKTALIIAKEGVNEVVGNAAGILGIVGIALKLLGSFVESTKPTSRTDPEGTGLGPGTGLTPKIPDNAIGQDTGAAVLRRIAENAPTDVLRKRSNLSVERSQRLSPLSVPIQRAPFRSSSNRQAWS